MCQSFILLLAVVLISIRYVALSLTLSGGALLHAISTCRKGFVNEKDTQDSVSPVRWFNCFTSLSLVTVMSKQHVGGD